MNHNGGVRCVIHTGVHRTGTTSVQRFLRNHVGEPRYPMGAIEPDQHLELMLYAIRPWRIYWDLVNATHRVPDNDMVRRLVRQWVDASRAAGTDLIVSSEGLSHLRFTDEVDRVLGLLCDAGVDDIDVIMVRRDPVSFTASFRLAQAITAGTGLSVMTDDDDTGPGSHLIDFDGQMALWSQRCRVHVFDLEDEVARNGSIIPAIARIVGVEPVEYRLNSSEWIKAQLAGAMRRQQR